MKISWLNESGELANPKNKFCSLLNGEECIHSEDKRPCNIICAVAKTYEREDCGVKFFDYSERVEKESL